MKKSELTIPDIALIAATRGLLGAGIGLLIASQISERRRRIIGSALVAVGAASTLPLAARVFSTRNSGDRQQDASDAG